MWGTLYRLEFIVIPWYVTSLVFGMVELLIWNEMFSIGLIVGDVQGSIIGVDLTIFRQVA